MGHVDERDPDRLLDPLQLDLQGLAHLQVERSQRLVEQQHLAVLIFFSEVGIPLGLESVLIAHVVFNASVVALVVRARFVGMAQDLEEASFDLGAGPLSTFRQVTLPRLAPAVLAGGLLAFTFSFDDFYTSFFVTGAGTSTLPLYIFSSLRFGVTPIVNATAAMILALTLGAVTVAYLVLRRAGASGASPAPPPRTVRS